MTQLLYKTQSRRLFHANIKLKFSVFYEDALFDEFYTIMQDVDNLYNSYSEQSYVYMVNKNAGKFVNVNTETVNILQKMQTLSAFFDGEYDITIMPLIRLWGFYRNEEKVIPNEEDIDRAKKLIDYKQIIIRDKTKVKINEGQEIITGSFIKAYAVDKVIERMKATGISDAIINAGGSTIMALTDDNHPYWPILIRNQSNQEELFTVKLSNKCFSTSAQNKTFVEINGEKYGHIISPKTGFPSTNKQVGIISDDCFSGDIISTGLFNLSGNEFIEKIKILSQKFDVEGFLIDKDNNIYYSEKFKQYIN